MLTNKIEAEYAPDWMVDFVQYIYPSVDKDRLNNQLYGISSTIEKLQNIIENVLLKFKDSKTKKIEEPFKGNEILKFENKILKDIYNISIKAYTAKKEEFLDQILTTYINKYNLEIVSYRLYLYNRPVKDFFVK